MNAQTEIHFDGHHYDPDLDRKRLTDQMLIIFETLYLSYLEGDTWLTIREINMLMPFEFPEPSISAQLRNMRKARFGGLDVRGRYRGGTRIYEYKFFPRSG